MSAFLAEALDLSRLPAFQLVVVDDAAERARMIAGAKARLNAVGLGYDADTLEPDPMVYMLEEVAFRKAETLAQLNDAGKKLMLPYSTGAALDQIAATYYADLGLVRLRIGTDAKGDPVYESDDRFKLRITLAPQARTPGTLGGYEYWALTAAPLLIDARALNYASGVPGISPGQITVVLYGIAAPTPAQVALLGPACAEAAQVALASATLRDRRVKLGTDQVNIVAAVRVPCHVEAIQYVRTGPTPALVEAAGIAALLAYDAQNRNIAKERTRNNIAAALTVGGVEDIGLLSPAANVDPGPLGVVEMDTPDIRAEVIDA